MRIADIEIGKVYLKRNKWRPVRLLVLGFEDGAVKVRIESGVKTGEVSCFQPNQIASVVKLASDPPEGRAEAGGPLAKAVEARRPIELPPGEEQLDAGTKVRREGKGDLEYRVVSDDPEAGTSEIGTHLFGLPKESVQRVSRSELRVLREPLGQGRIEISDEALFPDQPPIAAYDERDPEDLALDPIQLAHVDKAVIVAEVLRAYRGTFARGADDESATRRLREDLRRGRVRGTGTKGIRRVKDEYLRIRVTYKFDVIVTATRNSDPDDLEFPYFRRIAYLTIHPDRRAKDRRHAA